MTVVVKAHLIRVIRHLNMFLAESLNDSKVEKIASFSASLKKMFLPASKTPQVVHCLKVLKLQKKLFLMPPLFGDKINKIKTSLS